MKKTGIRSGNSFKYIFLIEKHKTFLFVFKRINLDYFKRLFIRQTALIQRVERIFDCEKRHRHHHLTSTSEQASAERLLETH